MRHLKVNVCACVNTGFFHLENKTNSDFYVTAAFSFNLQKILISAVK